MTDRAVGPASQQAGGHLLGRDRELASLRELIVRDDVRLVTVTGMSGIGKTVLVDEALDRLATTDQIAVRRVVFDDGSDALEHVGLIDALTGATVLAATFGAAPSGRHRVVALHGCEGVARLGEAVVEALEQDPGLTVVATSVVPLDLPIEQLLPLGPLATPEPSEDPSGLDDLPSIQLVRRHALRARPDTDWGDRERMAAARLVRVLEGLPLALEMAAARCRILSLEEVADLLDRGVALGALSERGGSARHMDLRAALRWSHDLLDPDARDLLARIGVLAGGGSWAAMAALAGDAVGSSGASDGSVAAPLSTLVDTGFVVPEFHEREGTRFRLPSAVRELALELLGERGQLEDARDRHAAHFRAVAATAARANCAPEWFATWRPIASDLPNFIAAAEHLARSGAVEEALALGVDLLPLWRSAAQPVTAVNLLRDLIERCGDDLPPERRALALAALAEMSMWSMLRASIGVDVIACLADARNAADAAASRSATLWVLDAAVPVQLLCMDADAAVAAAREGVAIAEAIGDRWWQARLLSWEAVGRHLSGETDAAVALADAARLLAQEIGDQIQMLRSNVVLLGLPDVDPALLPASEELLVVACELGAVFEEGALRAVLAVNTADPVAAAGHLLVTLDLGRRSGLWFLEELAVAAAVALATRTGRHEDAAQLIGGMSTRWPSLQLQVSPGQRVLYESCVVQVRQSLGDATFVRLETRGSAEGWDRTLACCRSLLNGLVGADAGPSSRAHTALDALTEREREVLEQMSGGLTNKQIARALGISPKTVSQHTSAIFRKLGVSTRTEAVIRARGWDG